MEYEADVFQAFRKLRPDSILQLTQDFRADARAGKFDLGVGADTVGRLRERHGVYMPASGRINIAGLRTRQVSRLVEALSDCLETEPVR